jgi:hypothetical protein
MNNDMNNDIIERIERLGTINSYISDIELDKERDEIIAYLKLHNVLEFNGDNFHFIGEKSEEYNYLYFKKYNC